MDKNAPSQSSETVLSEWGRLRIAWRNAREALDGVDNDRNMRAEQDAWDALVDFVEENGLNYTEYDPRGAE